MKKILAFLLVLCVVLPVFSNGNSEQKPLLFNNQNLNLIPTDNTAATGNSIVENNMARLTKLYKELEENYLWDIDHQAVYDAMAKAMFEALGDEYSEYYPADETEEYEEQNFGQYGGIGIVYRKATDDFCKLDQVYPNTPASKAGMKAGDQITHLNGESVIGMTSSETQKIMRGEPGTEITITVLRNDVSFDLTMKREKITVPSIDYGMLENKTGYILILKFINNTTLSDFRKAMNEMLSNGMTSLIIDLRDCGGGDVLSALQIADLFISNSDLLTIKYKHEENNQTIKATRGMTYSAKIPIAILTNGYTASASEILAATMRDNGRAIIFGSKTYGKGIMQGLSMPGSPDQYKYTMAYFFPPSGNEIHKVGVSPDVETVFPDLEGEELERFIEFINTDALDKWAEEHPAYTKENVIAFADHYEDTGFPRLFLLLQMRNRYYEDILYDDQPVADQWFDVTLIEAMDYLATKTTAK